MAVQIPAPDGALLPAPQVPNGVASFGGVEAAAREMEGATTQLGATIKNQADFIQDIRNENTARDASVALNGQMGTITSAYLQKQGQAADQGYDDYTAQLQAARASAVAAMPNMAAGKMLGDQAAYMVDRFQQEGTRHRGEAMTQWTRQSYAGALEDSANTAARDPTNTDLVAGQGARAKDAAKSLFAIDGGNPDTPDGAAALSATVAAAADKVYEPAILAASRSNPAAAQALFDAHKGEMTAAGIDRVTGALHADQRNSDIAAGINQTMATPLTPGNGIPAGGAPAQLDAGTRARAQDVHDVAVSQGASDAEAWGWAANAVHESGANPAPLPGDGGISHGMFQLNKDQLAAYQAQHGGHLPEQDDVATQVQFARAQAAPSLTGAQGPGGYAAAISTGFEVPANGPTEAANRAATAVQLAGGPAAAGPPTTGAQPAPGDHNAAPYGIEFQRMQIARTQAQQKFPNDQLAQRQWVDGVWQEIQQTNVLQAKYEAEQAKALHDGQQAEGQTVINSILKDPAHFDPTLLSNAKYLTWEQKSDLSNIAQKHFTEAAGGRESVEYGPGFWNAYQQVHSSDPTQKINDPSQLWSRGGPNGDLTLAGIDKLTTDITGSRSVEGAAYNKTIESYLASAHVAISGHGMMGGARDPVGEMNFSRFLPSAFAEIDKERAAGMSPVQMMNKGGALDLLVQHATRTPADLMRDMTGANNPDLGAAAGTASPTAAPAAALDLTTPAGINTAYRSGYFGVGQAAYDKASAELQRRGFVKNPNPAPAVPTNE